jgi:hypothetical protein
VKLMAGFVNAIGLGLIGFAILRPVTGNIANLTLPTAARGMVGLTLHGVSHFSLRYMRKAPT